MATNILDDATFRAKLKGRTDIGGVSKKWLKSGVNLAPVNDPKQIAMKMAACILLTENPVQFFVTGTTKSGKSDKQNSGAIQDLTSVLDTYDAEDRAAMDEESKNARAKKVKDGSFPEWYTTVNESSCRRTAMLFIEAAYELGKMQEIPIVKQWHDRYGVKPSMVMETNKYIRKLQKRDDDANLKLKAEGKKENQKSAEIKMEQFEAFREDKHLWNTNECLNIFKAKIQTMISGGYT